MTTIGIAAIAVLGYFALVWSLQRRVIYPRPAAPATDVTRASPGLVRLDPSGRRRVETWLLPPTSESARPYPVIVFAHGNGELIDYWVDGFREPREWGVGVLLVEYPGYGRSPGRPSEVAIAEAFVDAYDALVARTDVRAEAIVGYGRSLGGGAICALGGERPLAAVILESTFTSLVPLARGMAVPRFLVRDRFDNLAFLAGYENPVLLVHGTKDAVIPFGHAERLHQAASHSILRPIECGHNDCPRPWPLVRRFLADNGLLPSG